MLYVVKVFIPPNKSRLFYFQTLKEQQEWFAKLKQAVGYCNLFDYYEVEKTIGQGQFGSVKLAKHKRSGQQVAIKVIKKGNMSAQEIY